MITGCKAYLCHLDFLNIEARHAICPCPEARIAHQAVQSRPRGSEDPWRRPEGRLSERKICFLCFRGPGGEAYCGASCDGEKGGIGGVGEDVVRESQGRDIGSHAEHLCCSRWGGRWGLSLSILG